MHSPHSLPHQPETPGSRGGAKKAPETRDATHLLLLADGAVAGHPLHAPDVDGAVLLNLLQLLEGENHRDPGDGDVGPTKVMLPKGM